MKAVFRRHSLEGGSAELGHLQSVWAARSLNFLSLPSGVVAYRQRGKTLILAGAPFSKSGQSRLLWSELREFAATRRLSLCGYYFSFTEAEQSGLRPLQMGVLRKLNLKRFQWSGRSGQDVRRAVHFSHRKGYQFLEISNTQKNLWWPKLSACEKKWSEKHFYKFGFLLGGAKESFNKPEGRWFVLCYNQKVAAFVSLYSYDEGFYLDQMQRDPGVRLSMDALLSHVILLLKSESVKILNLGFCPARLERPKWGWESCIHGLYYGGWGFYPEGLYRFKKKYSDIEEPQFFLVDPRKAVLPQCYNMVCATLFDAKKISEN